MDSTRPKLVIRNSETRDAAGIARLSAKVYGRAEGYSAAQIRGQINNFPEGQFLAEYEGQIVGFCATLIVPEAAAMADHRWTAISGGGFGTRHDPDRSEEHTSELQSLMRISYAVFCLKKKKKHKIV